MPRILSSKFVDESSRQCSECKMVLAHNKDLRRHMRSAHEIRIVQMKHKCSWPNCSFETLQKSNLETHYRRHTKEKSKVCPDCEFRTGDPASLTRHRKRIHGYVPLPRKARADRKSLESVPSILQSQSPPEFSSSLDPNPSTSSLSLTESADRDVAPTNDFDFSSIPFNFDGLFCEPDPMFSSAQWPRPRPLFPAVESAPSLEIFSPVDLNYSALGFSQSLLFGVNPTSIPHFDSDILRISHEFAVSADLDTSTASSSLDGISALQTEQSPLDFTMKPTDQGDPSIPETVSECDFNAIFGPDYERFFRSSSVPESVTGYTYTYLLSPSPPSSTSPTSGFFTRSSPADLNMQ